MTSQEKKKTLDLTKLLLTVFLPGLSFHTESMCTYCHHLEYLWWSLHRGIPSHRKEEEEEEKKKTKNHVHISVKKLFRLPRIIPQPSPTFKKYSVILSQYGNKMEDHKVKESQLARGEPVGYFTSVAEDMNSGLPRTNPPSGQCWTWTRGLRGKEKFGHIVLL